MRGKINPMKIQDPLHILLTNDDGHRAPGIKVLYSTLKQQGHRVSMVAPSYEQSATGMGVTSRRNLALEQLETDIWHLDGQPVDILPLQRPAVVIRQTVEGLVDTDRELLFATIALRSGQVYVCPKL